MTDQSPEFSRRFAWLNGEPQISATFRNENADFQVVEQLGFEPEGEGEHVFLYIRKDGENTDWVARQLAGFCQVSPREVGYAGKKDRHAITEQWFSVRLGVHRNLNWQLFGGDSIQVLKAVRHPRKLRLGVLRGNRFRLRLCDVTDMDALEARFLRLGSGVPNYFGEQRFGFDFGNLDKGLALIRGELKERQRHKKGLYISAVRSWLFNRLLSERIDQGLWERILPGDVLMLDGSNSCFTADDDLHALQARLAGGDLDLTGPLPGTPGRLLAGEALEWESRTLAPWQSVSDDLEKLGLRSERRALRLRPRGLAMERESDRQCWIEFELPAGAFATSVLRELCHLSLSRSAGGLSTDD
ncbi:tRNA pseudouridine synthase D [Marinobacterium nitratireducens]|uniref:tRNA pseudouridine synthase D n=1 Tax=Marinobacterium nitratireducens TaxID=518897 RepID=A0A917ZJJ8_9GAMM|nr:tRNA pseudouridine(13) synthase TruD [Marinobacterium nitratireducens]GGO84573.1 tRNA pseudouridine synthase D [Marinobacterium nitratireducens]